MVTRILGAFLIYVVTIGWSAAQPYSVFRTELKGDWIATDMADSCYIKHTIRPFAEMPLCKFTSLLRITENEGIYATTYKSYRSNKLFPDTVEKNGFTFRILLTNYSNGYNNQNSNAFRNRIFCSAKDTANELWKIRFDEASDNLLLYQLSSSNVNKNTKVYVFKRFSYKAAGITEVTYKQDQDISSDDWQKVFDPEKILAGKYETIYRNNIETIHISESGYAKGINRIAGENTFETFKRMNVDVNSPTSGSLGAGLGFYDKVYLKLKNAEGYHNQYVFHYKVNHDSLFFFKSENATQKPDFSLFYRGATNKRRTGSMFVTDFSTGFMPGAGYTRYKPSADSLGTFSGAVLEYLLYASIHQDDDPGPSHVRVYLRMAQLKNEHEKWIQNFTAGVDLSFERNPHRNYMIPYFGIETGLLLQTGQTRLFHFTPTVGLHVLSTKRIFVNIQTGYLYTIKLVDTFKGNVTQATVNFTLW